MRPTRIYTRELLALRKTVGFDAAAHITGGGLPGNIPRVLPDGLGARIDRSSWSIPAIYRLLEEAGQLTWDDLSRTFNLGIGMVLAVAPDRVSAMLDATDGIQLGTVTEGSGVVFHG